VLKQIVGGQIGAYAEMCEQAREQAYDLLLNTLALYGRTLSWDFATRVLKLAGRSATEVCATVRRCHSARVTIGALPPNKR